MCGIIGVASRVPISDRRWLAAGRDAMRHRGPDDAGEWWSQDGRVGFGHRRLSILDLSSTGHQPMRDAIGDLCIVLNGEIYNFLELRRALAAKGHAFRTQTDTEVVLAAYREWGTDCLSRMKGMFAFGLYDASRRRLFLARDRAGEKPLFFAPGAETLRFASELKGLMADPTLPRRIDPESLDCYLTMGFVPGERCILRGVNKLPPGCALLFDLETGQSEQWRYWRIPALDPAAAAGAVDEQGLLDEAEALLANAVAQQLVADVPVGVLLSGGVDSSLVTALAARKSPKVKTFTIRFSGHSRFDETGHARLIARHFGTDHVELDAGQADASILPALARQFDEPIVDSSMVPTYMVAHLVRSHCTVALGGDGGDELFGGYFHYNRLLWIKKWLGGVPGGLGRPLGRAAGALLPVGFKGRNWLQALEIDFKTGLPLIASYFDAAARKALMNPKGRWRPSAEGIRARRVAEVPDLLQRATRTDFENYLSEDILVKVDRASMLNSLEVRAPLLDYPIIEFAYAKVPSYLKATSTSRKVLLKRLAERLLPPSFDRNRKQGFSIPLGSWLEGGSWEKLFKDVLLSPGDVLFDRGAVEQLFSGQAKGRSNSERLFALVLFELWRREYGVDF